MATQVVHAITAGADRLSWLITGTEKTGKDISGVTITTAVCLSNTGPVNFAAPPSLTRPTVSSFTFGVRINSTICPVAGEYEIWVKVGDGTEIIPELVAYFNVD